MAERHALAAAAFVAPLGFHLGFHLGFSFCDVASAHLGFVLLLVVATMAAFSSVSPL